MTQVEIKKLVAVLMAAFPSSKLTPETSGIYERMLADLEYPATNAAVEQLLATSKWVPTVAEIRERALDLLGGERKSGIEAWGEVRAIRSPREREAEGVDATAWGCLKALGMLAWDVVFRAGQPTDRWRVVIGENEPADRARFVELYDQLASKQRRHALTDGLPATQRFRALQAAKSEPKRLADVIPMLMPGTKVES